METPTDPERPVAAAAPNATADDDADPQARAPREHAIEDHHFVRPKVAPVPAPAVRSAARGG